MVPSVDRLLRLFTCSKARLLWAVSISLCVGWFAKQTLDDPPGACTGQRFKYIFQYISRSCIYLYVTVSVNSVRAGRFNLFDFWGVFKFENIVYKQTIMGLSSEQLRCMTRKNFQSRARDSLPQLVSLSVRPSTLSYFTFLFHIRSLALALLDAGPVQMV